MRRNELIFIFHVFIYTFGYGIVSFAYMPFLYYKGANQSIMGIVEFLLTFSNLFLPIIFIADSKSQYVKYFIIYSTISTSIFEFLIPGLDINHLIIIFFLIGISQFLWWYSTEIFMVSYLENSTLVNYYSITWGIAFLISPYLSSFIIKRMGYFQSFYIGSFLIIISSILFLDLMKINYRENENKIGRGKINIFPMIPALSSGIVLSLIYSIFSYLLLSNGYTIIMLGLVFFFVSLGRISGFFISIFIRNVKSVKIFTSISFFMMLFIVMPSITLNFYLILISSFLVSMGSSLGISLPLIEIYLDKFADRGRSIAIYELFFGIGISLFSLFGGYIGQYFGSKIPYILYMIIIAISFFIYRKGKNRMK